MNFSGLLQAIAGSALTILACVGIRLTGLGERLLDYRNAAGSDRGGAAKPVPQRSIL
jgi:hypothetical protein